MTLTLMIILNVVLDVALLGGLAYFMSHAGKLTPHQPSVSGEALPRQARMVRERTRTRGQRTSRRLHPALD
jgi:hypothetical protein